MAGGWAMRAPHTRPPPRNGVSPRTAIPKPSVWERERGTNHFGGFAQSPPRTQRSGTGAEIYGPMWRCISVRSAFISVIFSSFASSAPLGARPFRVLVPKLRVWECSSGATLLHDGRRLGGARASHQTPAAKRSFPADWHPKPSVWERGSGFLRTVTSPERGRARANGAARCP